MKLKRISKPLLEMSILIDQLRQSKVNAFDEHVIEIFKLKIRVSNHPQFLHYFFGF